MSRSIPYDPSRRALYTPCADAASLEASATRHEALLCAELSRLVYCHFDRDAAIEQHVREQLARIGFSKSSFFNESGLQAFLTVDPAKRLGVLAYRGTQPDEARDLLTDAHARLKPWAGTGNVHSGFANSLARKWPDIRAALDELAGFRLLYTGHSLGAALATLSAGLQPPVALYTFGSPRVGNAAFSASVAGIAHERYVDCADLVCQIPPGGFAYDHVGTRKYIDRNGALRSAISDADIRADQLRATLAYPFRYFWPPWKNVALRAFADHAPTNYIEALRAGL
jgi:triacylglycerol lipase